MIKYPCLGQFEENPDRKVSYTFIAGLFNEVGKEFFVREFKWFADHCLPDEEKDPAVKRPVFSWIAKFQDRCEFLLSLKQPILTEVNINSFSEDLEDIEECLFERAND